MWNFRIFFVFYSHRQRVLTEQNCIKKLESLYMKLIWRWLFFFQIPFRDHCNQHVCGHWAEYPRILKFMHLLFFPQRLPTAVNPTAVNQITSACFTTFVRFLDKTIQMIIILLPALNIVPCPNSYTLLCAFHALIIP